VNGRRWLLVAWIAAIVAVTAPWTSYQPHSHWYRVTWIPFTSPIRPLDLALNMLLYMPLGVLRGPRSAPVRRRDMLIVAASAFLLSAATELTQVYSHGRDPTATDVVSNVLGALLGLLLARRWFHVRTTRGSHGTDSR
jgi:glycopeptide antibiotics resistance protein